MHLCMHTHNNEVATYTDHAYPWGKNDDNLRIVGVLDRPKEPFYWFEGVCYSWFLENIILTVMFVVKLLLVLGSVTVLSSEEKQQGLSVDKGLLSQLFKHCLVSCTQGRCRDEGNRWRACKDKSVSRTSILDRVAIGCHSQSWPSKSTQSNRSP